ncbi:hypothetical protein [Serratia odorifera]|uniref:hypothetical protein n=1 Tax=Serratia odorifera TaxID=618 RepID=UPI0018E8BFFA|nr:hypothetical protein [Serratia odorifera]MBJ2065664.1 hypothetical protein [Serratia odorifera]
MRLFIEEKGRSIFSTAGDDDVLKFINLTALCAAFGISLQTVKTRLNRGLSLQDALTLPKHYNYRG